MSTEPDPASFILTSRAAALTGLAPGAIRRLVRDGTFPAPVRLDGRRLYFVLGEVVAWRAAVLTTHRSRDADPVLSAAGRAGGLARAAAH